MSATPNHVVILNDFAYVNGGASQVALSSAQGLASAGVNVTLFAAVGPVDAALQDQTNLSVIHLGQHEILNDPNRSRAFRQVDHLTQPAGSWPNRHPLAWLD
jgi:hypothetical protein